MSKKCVFTTSIADTLECDPKGNFDDYGFPLQRCKLYPCEKLKEIIKSLNEIKREEGKTIIRGE